jgi:hypothetical protein
MLKGQKNPGNSRTSQQSIRIKEVKIKRKNKKKGKEIDFLLDKKDGHMVGIQNVEYCSKYGTKV